MPCTDSMSILHQEDTTVATNVSDSHNHSEESKDCCTPFCTCQCCGTSITIPPLLQLREGKKQLCFSYTSHYSFSYNYDYSNGIWHPPITC